MDAWEAKECVSYCALCKRSYHKRTPKYTNIQDFRQFSARSSLILINHLPLNRPHLHISDPPSLSNCSLMARTELYLSLRSRLLAVEQDFISDDVSLQIFEEKWDTVRKDYEEALKAGLVDDSLKTLANSIFFRMAILGVHLERAQEEAEALTTSFSTEIEDLLSRMSIGDMLETNSSTSSPSYSPLISRGMRISTASGNSCLSSLPPFIPSAFDWIVRHLDNPYPSNILKASIASNAGVPLRAVTDWFQSIRRHIGWASFCKKRFLGYRSLIIAAAKTFFAHKDEDTALPLDVVSAFLTMKEKLDSLYLEERGLQPSSSTYSQDKELAQTPFPFAIPSPSSSVQTHACSISASTNWLIEPLESSPPPSPMRAPSLVAESAASDSDDDEQLQELPSQSSAGDVLAWSTENSYLFNDVLDTGRKWYVGAAFWGLSF
jgi:hypothetical protein